MTDSHAEQLPVAQRAHRVERVLDVLREHRGERCLDGAVQLALNQSIAGFVEHANTPVFGKART